MRGRGRRLSLHEEEMMGVGERGLTVWTHYILGLEMGFRMDLGLLTKAGLFC